MQTPSTNPSAQDHWRLLLPALRYLPHSLASKSRSNSAKHGAWWQRYVKRKCALDKQEIGVG